MKKKLLITVVVVIAVVGFCYITFIFMSSVFDKDEKNSIYTYNMERTIKMQLNQVIEDIESFKNENNVYPTNLDFLNEVEGSLHNPYDIACVGSSKHGSFLQYGILENGNNFYIFSIGLDLKPYTSDDIFIEENKISFKSGYVERPILQQP